MKVCQKTYKDGKAELQKEQEVFVAGVQQEIDTRKLQTEERKQELKQAQENELNGRGADTTTIRKYDDRLTEIRKELDYIHEYRPRCFIMKGIKRSFLIKNRLRETGKKNWTRNLLQ